MDLIKEKWTEKDRESFVKYLESLAREDKIEWTKNIINTEMRVLAIKNPEIVSIVKQIKKGNFLSFLDLNIRDYYENILINGKLICEIKDFSTMKKYLDIYSKMADNWAVCDTLKFKVKGKEEEFFYLATDYSRSKLPFVRRIGMSILFSFIDNDEYIDKIYMLLNQFQDETEYYVNMINAWLVCELFIKRRDKTIDFLNNNLLNDFTMNKAISKCRDSFRVTEKDKEKLLSFKRK